jgi:hypothetical protein
MVIGVDWCVRTTRQAARQHRRRSSGAEEARPADSSIKGTVHRRPCTSVDSGYSQPAESMSEGGHAWGTEEGSETAAGSSCRALSLPGMDASRGRPRGSVDSSGGGSAKATRKPRSRIDSKDLKVCATPGIHVCVCVCVVSLASCGVVSACPAREDSINYYHIWTVCLKIELPMGQCVSCGVGDGVDGHLRLPRR